MRLISVRTSLLVCLLSLSCFFLHAQPITTTTTASVSPSTVQIGQQFLVTATVTPASGPVSELNGLTVIFYGPDSSQVAATLSNGKAQGVFTGTASPTGLDIINANFQDYEGEDVEYQSSTGVAYANVIPVTNSELSGSYVFTFGGPGESGSVGSQAGIGAFIIQGYGKLVGEVDVNSATGVLMLPLTGTYSFASPGVGTMTLTTSQGSAAFDLFTPKGSYTASASMIETDGKNLFGSARLFQQNTYHFFPEFTPGSYASHLVGETPCNACAATEPVVVTGILTFAIDGSLSGLTDQSIGSSLVKHVGVTGTWVPADFYGRVPLQIKAPGEPSSEPTNYAGYILDTAHMFLFSTDPHGKAILLTGDLRR